MDPGSDEAWDQTLVVCRLCRREVPASILEHHIDTCNGPPPPPPPARAAAAGGAFRRAESITRPVHSAGASMSQPISAVRRAPSQPAPPSSSAAAAAAQRLFAAAGGGGSARSSSSSRSGSQSYFHSPAAPKRIGSDSSEPIDLTQSDDDEPPPLPSRPRAVGGRRSIASAAELAAAIPVDDDDETDRKALADGIRASLDARQPLAPASASASAPAPASAVSVKPRSSSSSVSISSAPAASFSIVRGANSLASGMFGTSPFLASAAASSSSTAGGLGGGGDELPAPASFSAQPPAASAASSSSSSGRVISVSPRKPPPVRLPSATAAAAGAAPSIDPISAAVAARIAAAAEMAASGSVGGDGDDAAASTTATPPPPIRRKKSSKNALPEGAAAVSGDDAKTRQYTCALCGAVVVGHHKWSGHRRTNCNNDPKRDVRRSRKRIPAAAAAAADDISQSQSVLDPPSPSVKPEPAHPTDASAAAAAAAAATSAAVCANNPSHPMQLVWAGQRPAAYGERDVSCGVCHAPVLSLSIRVSFFHCALCVPGFDKCIPCHLAATKQSSPALARAAPALTTAAATAAAKRSPTDSGGGSGSDADSPAAAAGQRRRTPSVKLSFPTTGDSAPMLVDFVKRASARDSPTRASPSPSASPSARDSPSHSPSPSPTSASPAIFDANPSPPPVVEVKRRGRPPGSLNKRKSTADESPSAAAASSAAASKASKKLKQLSAAPSRPVLSSPLSADGYDAITVTTAAAAATGGVDIPTSSSASVLVAAAVPLEIVKIMQREWQLVESSALWKGCPAPLLQQLSIARSASPLATASAARSASPASAALAVEPAPDWSLTLPPFLKQLIAGSMSAANSAAGVQFFSQLLELQLTLRRHQHVQRPVVGLSGADSPAIAALPPVRDGDEDGDDGDGEADAKDDRFIASPSPTAAPPFVPVELSGGAGSHDILPLLYRGDAGAIRVVWQQTVMALCVDRRRALPKWLLPSLVVVALQPATPTAVSSNLLQLLGGLVATYPSLFLPPSSGDDAPIVPATPTPRTKEAKASAKRLAEAYNLDQLSSVESWYGLFAGAVEMAIGVVTCVTTVPASAARQLPASPSTFPYQLRKCTAALRVYADLFTRDANLRRSATAVSAASTVAAGSNLLCQLLDTIDAAAAMRGTMLPPPSKKRASTKAATAGAAAAAASSPIPASPTFGTAAAATSPVPFYQSSSFLRLPATTPASASGASVLRERDRFPLRLRHAVAVLGSVRATAATALSGMRSAKRKHESDDGDSTAVSSKRSASIVGSSASTHLTTSRAKQLYHRLTDTLPSEVAYEVITIIVAYDIESLLYLLDESGTLAVWVLNSVAGSKSGQLIGLVAPGGDADSSDGSDPIVSRSQHWFSRTEFMADQRLTHCLLSVPAPPPPAGFHTASGVGDRLLFSSLDSALQLPFRCYRTVAPTVPPTTTTASATSAGTGAADRPANGATTLPVPSTAIPAAPIVSSASIAAAVPSAPTLVAMTSRAAVNRILPNRYESSLFAPRHSPVPPASPSALLELLSEPVLFEPYMYHKIPVPKLTAMCEISRHRLVLAMRYTGAQMFGKLGVVKYELQVLDFSEASGPPDVAADVCLDPVTVRTRLNAEHDYNYPERWTSFPLPSETSKSGGLNMHDVVMTTIGRGQHFEYFPRRPGPYGDQAIAWAQSTVERYARLVQRKYSDYRSIGAVNGWNDPPAVAYPATATDDVTRLIAFPKPYGHIVCTCAYTSADDTNVATFGVFDVDAKRDLAHMTEEQARAKGLPVHSTARLTRRGNGRVNALSWLMIPAGNEATAAGAGIAKRALLALLFVTISGRLGYIISPETVPCESPVGDSTAILKWWSTAAVVLSPTTIPSPVHAWYNDRSGRLAYAQTDAKVTILTPELTPASNDAAAAPVLRFGSVRMYERWRAASEKPFPVSLLRIVDETRLAVVSHTRIRIWDLQSPFVAVATATPTPASSSSAAAATAAPKAGVYYSAVELVRPPASAKFHIVNIDAL